MYDIEKVIRGLECCFRGNDCRNCPYKEVFDPERPNLDCIDMTREDAIALLKAQVKAPVVFNIVDGSIESVCGDCGCYLDKAYSTCPQCKKELDWNDQS